eukprot:1937660-Alexandrium_andersonii.AAC.2
MDPDVFVDEALEGIGRGDYHPKHAVALARATIRSSASSASHGPAVHRMASFTDGNAERDLIRWVQTCGLEVSLHTLHLPLQQRGLPRDSDPQITPVSYLPIHSLFHALHAAGPREFQ